MNLKIAILLFLMFSASAITLAAATFTSPTLNVFASTEKLFNLNHKIQPLGDPVDDVVAPL